jgi:hypothetical protein
VGDIANPENFPLLLCSLTKGWKEVRPVSAFYSLKQFVTNIVTWSNNLSGNLCLVYELKMGFPWISTLQLLSNNFSSCRITIQSGLV